MLRKVEKMSDLENIFNEALKENTKFLDENFPKWRDNKYINKK